MFIVESVAQEHGSYPFSIEKQLILQKFYHLYTSNEIVYYLTKVYPLLLLIRTLQNTVIRCSVIMCDYLIDLSKALVHILCQPITKNDVVWEFLKQLETATPEFYSDICLEHIEIGLLS